MTFLCWVLGCKREDYGEWFWEDRGCVIRQFSKCKRCGSPETYKVVR